MKTPPYNELDRFRYQLAFRDEMYLFHRCKTFRASKVGNIQRQNNNNSKHNVFYLQFRPVIFLLTAFGRISIQKDEKGVYEWKWLSWKSLYCLVVYSVQTYLAVEICRNRIKSVFESKSYDEFIFAIHVLAYVQLHFHVPITYWVHGPQYARYLNLWSQFQAEWNLLSCEPLHLKYRRLTLIYILVNLPAIALVLILEKYSTLHDPFEYLLPYYFTITSAILDLGTWYITSLEISHISKNMTDILVNKLNAYPDQTFLQNWRNVWISMGSLVTELGTDQCAVMISIFLTFSVTFLLGSYNALSKIMVGDSSLKTFGYLTASGISLLIIFIMCDAGHRATTNVEAYTSKCIMSASFPSPQEHIKYELKQWLVVLCMVNVMKLTGKTVTDTLDNNLPFKREKKNRLGQ